MANYNLVIDSTFRPFTFDEYIKPYQLYGEAYREQENAYMDMLTKAGELASKLNPDVDKDSFTEYQNFINSLSARASELASVGLTPRGRSEITGLRKTFATDITGIMDAYNRRAKEIEERKALGDSAITDYEPSEMSVDYYRNNPSTSFKLINRDNVYKKAVNAFSALEKDLNSYGPGDDIDAYTNTFLAKYGVTPADAAAFIDNVRAGRLDQANPTLLSMFNAVVNSSGVNEWNSERALRQVMDTVLEAVPAAIGESKVTPIESFGDRENLQQAHAMARQHDAQAFQRSENEKNRQFEKDQQDAAIAGKIAVEGVKRGASVEYGGTKVQYPSNSRGSAGNSGGVKGVRLSAPVAVKIAEKGKDIPTEYRGQVTMGTSGENDPVRKLLNENAGSSSSIKYEEIGGKIRPIVNRALQNADPSLHTYTTVKKGDDFYIVITPTTSSTTVPTSVSNYGGYNSYDDYDPDIY